MDLSNMRTDRAHGKVKYMGEDFAFVYHPNMVTPKNYDKLRKVENLEEAAEFFSQLLYSWDLTENGEELPVTEEVISRLPLMLFREIAQYIMGEVPQKDLGKELNASLQSVI